MWPVQEIRAGETSNLFCYDNIIESSLFFAVIAIKHTTFLFPTLFMDKFIKSFIIKSKPATAEKRASYPQAKELGPMYSAKLIQKGSTLLTQLGNDTISVIIGFLGPDSRCRFAVTCMYLCKLVNEWRCRSDRAEGRCILCKSHTKPHKLSDIANMSIKIECFIAKHMSNSNAIGIHKLLNEWQRRVLTRAKYLRSTEKQNGKNMCDEVPMCALAYQRKRDRRDIMAAATIHKQQSFKGPPVKEKDYIIAASNHALELVPVLVKEAKAEEEENLAGAKALIWVFNVHLTCAARDFTNFDSVVQKITEIDSGSNTNNTIKKIWIRINHTSDHNKAIDHNRAAFSEVNNRSDQYL